MAEENMVEETTQQESPSVEENQAEVEATESAEKPEQTPEVETEVVPEQSGQDKNWKALREEKEKLERELKELKSQPKETIVESVQKSSVAQAWLTPEDNTTLQLDEFRAQQRHPELDDTSDSYDPLFEKLVAGEYTKAINNYVNNVVSGKQVSLPKVTRIADDIKTEWQARFSKSSKEVAKQVKESVKGKESTVEAEGRSDRRPAPTQDAEQLRQRSQRGDYDAVAERLVRSGL